jgi:hypothetical protein
MCSRRSASDTGIYLKAGGRSGAKAGDKERTKPLIDTTGGRTLLRENLKRGRQRSKQSIANYNYAILRSAATGAYGEIQSGCTSTKTDLRRRLTERIKR